MMHVSIGPCGRNDTASLAADWHLQQVRAAASRLGDAPVEDGVKSTPTGALLPVTGWQVHEHQYWAQHANGDVYTFPTR